MKSPSMTRALHPNVRDVIRAFCALFLFALSDPARLARAADQRAPELVGDCQRLQVEAGNKVAFHVFGVGVQIYRWSGTSWVFVAPEAVLYANAGDKWGSGHPFRRPHLAEQQR